MKPELQISTLNSIIRNSFIGWLTVGVISLMFSGMASAGSMVGSECTSISERPLSDFLDVQGTSGSSFFPPVPDYVGFAGGDFEYFALVDYAGLANETIVQEGGNSLGTEFSGRILECALSNGTARISIVLETRNAMGFAQSIQDLIDNGFDFAGTDTIFGNKAVDIADGAQAAVGSSSLRTSFFIAGPGEDLPDFFAVVNDSETYGPYSFDFRSTTVGRRPDGTKARLRIQQVCTAEKGGDQICSREIVDLN